MTSASEYPCGLDARFVGLNAIFGIELEVCDDRSRRSSGDELAPGTSGRWSGCLSLPEEATLALLALSLDPTVKAAPGTSTRANRPRHIGQHESAVGSLASRGTTRTCFAPTARASIVFELPGRSRAESRRLWLQRWPCREACTVARAAQQSLDDCHIRNMLD